MTTKQADQNTNYEALLFDLDGVLLEGPATDAEVYQAGADAAIKEFHCSVTDEQRRKLGKYPFDEQMAACCRELGIDPADFWSRRERLASEIANLRIADGVRSPYPDTKALAEIRDEFDIALGIVSNNRAHTVTFVAETLFGEVFSLAIGREPTVEGYRRKKPDGYYLDLALSELEVDTAVYVGDRETDMVAASSVGIDTAFIRRGHNSKISLDQAPTYDIESLEALPGIVDR